MKDFWYVIGAYSVIWVIIGGYLVSLGGKMTELTRRIDAVQAEKEG
jgi:CcmD family protein